MKVERLEPTHPLAKVRVEMGDIPRGKYTASASPKDEAEHFIRCPACGGWIDCRDFAQVFEHEGPIPHPAEDQPQ